MKKVLALTAAIILLCMVGGTAFAGWTVVNLQPAGATDWDVSGLSGGKQVGSADGHASLWSGTAASWVDLHPAGATFSWAYGVSGSQQAGSVGGHAALWSGTAGSWVDFHPAAARSSCAYGVSDGQQVGTVYIGDYTHAALWSGTAASWVDLHPSGGAWSSQADAVSGGQQVGKVDFYNYMHAGLWSGTAESFVDLNPSGALHSHAWGVSGGQQVGTAYASTYTHAGLWSGTAESWVSLDPAGSTGSYGNAISGGKQAGTVRIGGGNYHAALWSGTAASWVDLHALLPAGVYSRSEAKRIDVSGGEIWIGGWAQNAPTGQGEVMLWHYVPRSSAVGIRACDLYNQVIPPNPVKTWGKVTSTSPLRISDGRAEIEVTGLSDLDMGDYLWVEGDWNGSVLAASQDPQKAKVYKSPSKTEMVYVPAGSFQMGNNGGEPYSYDDELPQHWVHLSGYWIGKYEVTRGEYRQFMNAGGYSNPVYWSSAGWIWKEGLTEPDSWAASQDHWGTGTFTQTDNHPVAGVTYYESEAFCNWAGSHLPTEAQWEKAARWTGSSPRVYPWGDTWDPEKCNNFYDTNPAGGGYGKWQTAPVGSYPSGVSPYGCHDMAGNVSEWVQDWYKSYPGSTNPFDYTGSYRVLRGGGWSIFGNFNRCAYRNYYHLPYDYWNDYGFRLAR